MKWDAEDPDWLFSDVAPRLRLLMLVLYTQHLATGQTLTSRVLKSSTVKTYIANINGLLAICAPSERDFRKTHATDKSLDPMLESIFTEMARFESIPNKREPFTLEMLECLDDWSKQAQPDSLFPALADWFLVGLYGGLRLSEWAQPDHAAYRNLSTPQQNQFGDPSAFCLGDFTFGVATKNGRSFRKITAIAAAKAPTSTVIVRGWILWRTQKNGDNGETRLFTTNPNPEGRNCVIAMLGIVKRLLRVCPSAHDKTPLALFRKDGERIPRPINATHIEQTMRALAAEVYNYHPTRDRKALQQWSSHSLRVGGCVILFSQGYTGAQIKFLLRWRSDAFMAYLRNLAVTSDKHNITMDNAAAMPNFL